MSNNYRADKLWYSHRMEYYTAMKRNRLSLHAAPWINLVNIINLCKRKQPQKVHTISIYETCKWANLIHADGMQNGVATSGGESDEEGEGGCSWILAMPCFSIGWYFHGCVHSVKLHLAVELWFVHSSANFNKKLTSKILTPDTCIANTY